MSLDRVYYYNRNGILKLTLNEYPFYAGDADFKDWKWEHDSLFGSIRNFRRAKGSYSFVVSIASKDLSDRDALCSIFSEDVIAGQPGYLMIRGWKLECYVVEAKHKWFGALDHQITFEATAVNSTWIRESTRTFNGRSGGGSESGADLGRDYTFTGGILGRGYDYGYNIGESHSGAIDLANSGAGYEITIYGPANNPVIYLDNRPVRVNVSISASERLQIISSTNEKSINILSASGEKTSAFVHRDKENSPFLSLGEHTELTYGEIRFDFKTIERRSEPSWT